MRQRSIQVSSMSLREKNKIKMRYLNWLEHFVYDKRRASYALLFKHLHQREFIFPLPMDDARAMDGIELRDRFAREKGFSYEEIEDILDGPCSVLEMLVGLALRMEISLTSDPDEGDRTGLWFWGMLTTMKLASQTDDRYDPEYVNNRIDIMLYREYRPNGEGGLFELEYADRDMRDVEIWYQMNYFLIELDERKEKQERELRERKEMMRR